MHHDRLTLEGVVEWHCGSGVPCAMHHAPRGPSSREPLQCMVGRMADVALETLAQQGYFTVATCLLMFHTNDICRTDYLYPGGASFNYLIFVVPVRPGVCRTFFKAAAGRSSSSLKPAAAEDGDRGTTAEGGKPTAAAASAAALSSPDKGGKPSASAAAVSLPSSLVRTLAEGLPHYLLQPQNLIDQDTVMLHQQVGQRVGGGDVQGKGPGIRRAPEGQRSGHKSHYPTLYHSISLTRPHCHFGRRHRLPVRHINVDATPSAAPCCFPLIAQS